MVWKSPSCEWRRILVSEVVISTALRRGRRWKVQLLWMGTSSNPMETGPFRQCLFCLPSLPHNLHFGTDANQPQGDAGLLKWPTWSAWLEMVGYREWNFSPFLCHPHQLGFPSVQWLVLHCSTPLGGSQQAEHGPQCDQDDGDKKEDEAHPWAVCCPLPEGSLFRWDHIGKVEHVA